MSSPVPRFITVPDGQLRVWIDGDGPPLVILPGLLRGPVHRTREAAALFPQHKIIAVEMPGLGASSTTTGVGISQAAAAIRHWLMRFHEPINLLACDLAIPVAMKLLDSCEIIRRVALLQARINVEAPAGGRPLADLALENDGTHLLKLWAHLRSQDMLRPDDPLRARDGDRYMSAEELDEALLCFGVTPSVYAQYWNEAIESRDAAASLPPRVAQCDSLGGAALFLADDSPSFNAPLPGDDLPEEAITRQYVQIGRGRVHLRRAGRGRLILAFLAGAGSSANLAPLLEGLSESFLVVAPDYIGQGDSCRDTSATTIAQLARDANEVASALGYSRYDVYGTHTGAGVALEVALAFPERVGKVIIDGMNMQNPAERAEHREKYFPRIVPDVWGSHVHIAWNVRRDGGYFWPWYRPEPASARAGRAPTLPLLHDRVICTLRSRTTPAYQAAASYAARSRLPMLQRPCLFVAGPSDTFADDFDKARAISGPNVQFLRVPATVWFAGQDPAAVTATMRTFAEFLSIEGRADNDA